MNLQDLRDELSARAATADEHSPDLLPGVHRKIRHTRQRRAATVLGTIAAIAALAVGVVPALHTSTPDPAGDTPQNYTRDGVTVPGTIGPDKLLKAWIGDRDQDKLSFSWTPATTSITISAICTTTGDGMKSVRIRIGDWRIAEAGCTGDEGWQLNRTQLYPDSSFWLDHPLGQPVEVSAEVIDLQTRKTGAQNARIAIGIYSTEAAARDAGSGLPTRLVQPGPSDYTANGVTYRAKFGGDKLAGASVAAPGETETRFSFTATGAPLVLHSFCTANRGSDTNPYQVSVRLGAGTPYLSTCDGSSTDGTLRSSLTIPSPAPAGQRIDVVARIVPARTGVPPVPADSRLGVGIYFQGAQRVVDGVSFPQQTEVAGYVYRLGEVKTAPAPARRVYVVTPANQPYVIGYAASALGTGRFDATLTVGKSETGLSVDPRTVGLGVGWDGHGAAPADRATLTIGDGRPTKGTLMLAIYVLG